LYDIPREAVIFHSGCCAGGSADACYNEYSKVADRARWLKMNSEKGHFPAVVALKIN